MLGLLLLAFVLAASSARAQEGVERARELFAKGVELFQKGDHAAALEAFLEADQAHHAPPITYNVARARESLGQAQAAIDAYEAYVAEAGEAGEFTGAATVAIAQIKARSTRLRIETTPSGARVRIDGSELRDPTPTSVFLFRGKHAIEIEKDDWKERREFEAPGTGDASTLTLVRTQAPAPEPVPAPAPAPAAPKRELPKDSGIEPAAPPELDGLMGGAGVSLSGYSFIGDKEEREQQAETSSDATAKGLVFGLMFEAGWALSARMGLMLRGFGGLGTAEDELAALGAGGPALSYRLASDWWLGIGAIFGGSRAEGDATKRPIGSLQSGSENSSVTYRTDFATGPALELSYVLTQTETGQWLASMYPAMLLTTSGEQSTVFIPVVLGYRWF